MKKKIKIAGMTATIMSSAGITPSAAVADDLLQDAGSWLQVVGEGRAVSMSWIQAWKKVESGWKDNTAGMITGTIGKV